MKQYNEYEDKLVSYDTAVKADSVGYTNLSNKYDIECFTCDKDTKTIFDNWAGLIPDGHHFLCHRPTISGLQKWLRNVHRIHVFIGFRPHIQKFDSYAYSLDMSPQDHKKWRTMQKFTDQQIFNDYESALEAGVVEGLQLLLDI